MIPSPGMTGIFVNQECSLRVEVISYDASKRIVNLKVLKSLTKNCPYEVGKEFTYQLPEMDEANGLERLILE